MLIEDCQNIVLRCLRSADSFDFTLGIRHPGFQSGPDDQQLRIMKESIEDFLAFVIYYDCSYQMY